MTARSALSLHNRIGSGHPFRAVEIGFAGCSALLAALLYAVYKRPVARPGDSRHPGLQRGVAGAARDIRRDWLIRYPDEPYRN